MPLSQDNRPLAVTTPLGKDVLLLRRFTGHEAMSKLFSFGDWFLSIVEKSNSTWM